MDEKKILIVDDEESICEMIGEILTAKGYEVQSATSAEEGMDILNEEDIPVIFLDLYLPGMSGVELCRKMRESGSNAFIYAITGYSSLFAAEECMKAGFDDFFTKPVKIDVLDKAVKNAFDYIKKNAGAK
jgi:DNA-binding response OmpR family regulator